MSPEDPNSLATLQVVPLSSLTSPRPQPDLSLPDHPLPLDLFKKKLSLSSLPGSPLPLCPTAPIQFPVGHLVLEDPVHLDPDQPDHLHLDLLDLPEVSETEIGSGPVLQPDPQDYPLHGLQHLDHPPSLALDQAQIVQVDLLHLHDPSKISEEEDKMEDLTMEVIKSPF